MNSYRTILYRGYSESFAAQKGSGSAIQYSLYESTYHSLPQSREARVLDLGCGKGEWLAWLAAKGYRKLTGVDGSAGELALARSQTTGPDWVISDALAFLEGCAPDSFDLIHAKDLIEHFTKDEFLRFLQASHRALHPGGQLWLLTFNAQSPLSTATRYGDFTHETGHTPSSLAQCLRACGYGDIMVQGRYYCSTSFGGRMRAALGFGFYHAARFILKLRHGSGIPSPGVDAHSSLPDLFAQGIKAA